MRSRPGVTRSPKIQTLQRSARPSRDEALRAVETLMRWAGDDPLREGLAGTQERVVKAFHEFFDGYAVDPIALTVRTFEAVEGYDELGLTRDIRFESHSAHNMDPGQDERRG